MQGFLTTQSTSYLSINKHAVDILQLQDNMYHGVQECENIAAYADANKWLGRLPTAQLVWNMHKYLHNTLHV